MEARLGENVGVSMDVRWCCCELVGAAAENHHSNMVPTTRPMSQISDVPRIVSANIFALLWTRNLTHHLVGPVVTRRICQWDTIQIVKKFGYFLLSDTISVASTRRPTHTFLTMHDGTHENYIIKAGKNEIIPITNCRIIAFLIGKPLRLTMRRARTFANDAMGSMLPARPASTAICEAMRGGTAATVRIS